MRPQFLDTVWQLVVQYPRVFEFTPRMLLIMADHVYSCRFGTFLFNNEREQSSEQVDINTPSLWGHIRAIAPSLTNPLYDASVSTAVPCVASLCPVRPPTLTSPS